MAARFMERELTLALDRQIGPEAMAKRLAEFSRERLAEVIRSGEGSSSYDTFVNGRPGAAEESVVPPGPIVYEFNWWDEVLLFAVNFLRARSPVGGPGGHKGRRRYRDSFFTMADDREVFTRHWKTIPGGAVVVIGNDAPYSRKLDVQLIGSRPIKVSVPPGIFDDAAVAVKARFQGLVNARRLYTYRLEGVRNRRVTGRVGPKSGHAGEIHFPALQMTMRS